MIDCLYRRLGADGEYQVYESTPGTASNWSAEIQHGSPPLALMTKAIEELADQSGGQERSDPGNQSGGQERSDPGNQSGGQERSDSGNQSGSALRVGRLTLDLLGAVPVAPVRVRAWVLRPGTRISLMTAEMTASVSGGGDRVVARVTAWLLARSDTGDAATDRYPPLVEGESVPHAHGWQGAPGYLETVSWRTQSTAAGDAALAWLSPLVPLVDSEETTDVQRLAMVVDSANGVGAALDPEHFVFMNTDTTVHLHRSPQGSDFALRARASIGPDGIGVTTAEIFDRRGFIGTSAQTLLIQRR